MRYALYFAPPADAPLTRAAVEWLCRDAFETDLPSTTPPVPPAGNALAPDLWKTVTADPRRYGFHATIKAPFRLAEGRSEEELLHAVAAFAARWQPFDIGVALAGIGPFFALVEDAPSPALAAFAEAVVRDFELFRAALTEAEFARRRPERLSPRERALLEEFGYPHVLDEFEFHMSLTGPVAAEQSKAVRTVLQQHFHAFIGRPLSISHLAVFQEQAPGADFTVRALYALGTSKEI